jgi:GNAT superfamily N-acetyltransferase
MAESVRVRTAGDLERCVSLLGLVHGSDGYPRHWPAQPTEWLAPPNQVAAWVAEGDGLLLGHVALARSGKDVAAATWSSALGVPVEELLCVSLLFVSPQARGRGVGRRLLSVAEAAAWERGKRPVLEVVSLDRHAVALYRRCGWREVGAVQRGWLPTGTNALLFAAPRREH